MPSTFTRSGTLMNVAVHPATESGRRYRSSRETAARVAGLPAEPGLNLRYFGGRTIEHLTFTHRYLGGADRWSSDDIAHIDWALPAAMRDRRLNNVIAQYYDGLPTSTFAGSEVAEDPLPGRVFRSTVEDIVGSTDTTAFDLESTVFCFFLPRGVVLVNGEGAHAHRGDDEDDEPRFNPSLREREAGDSKHGLGGYHGSIHRSRNSRKQTIYYAVGVYDEGSNGIVVFAEPWKNICAVFYHELMEARTDPDIEDAIRAGDTPGADRFLGWYSPRGGEIADIPLDEAFDLADVMKEVTLTGSTRKVPVQLLWSNAVSGPEGPIARKHRRAR
jgi:hypothetical protein